MTDLYLIRFALQITTWATEFDLYIIRFLRTRDLPPVRRQNNRRKVVRPPGVAVGGGRTKKNRGVFNWRRQDPGRKRIPRPGRFTGGPLSLFAFHTHAFFLTFFTFILQNIHPDVLQKESSKICSLLYKLSDVPARTYFPLYTGKN